MELPKRKPNRLKNWDYSSNGAYFITVCVKDKHELLWKTRAQITDAIESPPLSDYGLIIDDAIHRIHDIYTGITVDRYVIMPNHIHMILILTDDNRYAICSLTGAQCAPLQTTGDGHAVCVSAITDAQCAPLQTTGDGHAVCAPAVSTVINQMKGCVTKQIGFSIWQKSFYDHIIRCHNEYLHISKYIDENPIKWELDCYYNKEGVYPKEYVCSAMALFKENLR